LSKYIEYNITIRCGYQFVWRWALLKVFIADDDELISKGLKVIIEKNTSYYKVIGQASDGEEALAAIKRLKPDLLITDIKMPIMDGIELIKNIRKLNLNIKIVVLSGFDEYKYLRETLKNGVKDYLLKPVENNDLLELLEQVKNEIEAEEKNMHEYKELNEIAVKSTTFLQEKYFKDLIRGNYSEIDRFERKVNNFEFSKAVSFILAIIKVDNFYVLKKRGDTNVYETIFAEIKNLIILFGYEKRNEQQICAINDGDKLTVLFPTMVEYQDEFQNDVVLVIENLMKNLLGKYNYKITTGISNTYNIVERTHIANHQAEFANERKFYEGTGKIVAYDSEKCIYKNILKKIIESKLIDLTNNVELGQIYKSKRAMEEIVKNISSQNISPSEFKETLAYVVQRLFVLCPEFKNIYEYYPEKYDLLYSIEGIDTLVELNEYLVSNICSMVEKITLERSERSIRIIEIAKKYISENYTSEIRLKTVADYVHLNPSYLSELFKNEAGQNFMDFLTNTRVNAAKKLLAIPRDKIYEIAQAVGYEDTTTFNRAFKKITGISPSEYRNLLK